MLKDTLVVGCTEFGRTPFAQGQIDNPLVRVIDPTFIGLHASAPDSSSQMSSKMVPKAHAGEKVGVLCRVDGELHALDALCPHEGGRIHDGPLAQGKYAVCPLHNYKFDPRTGEAVECGRPAGWTPAPGGA